MPGRDERIKEAIRREASAYIGKESNRQSLITVTNVLLSADKKRATILVTVLPDTQSAQALDFLKRQRGDFFSHLEKNKIVSRPPFLDFALDKGEMNRQHIEDISKSLEN